MIQKIGIGKIVLIALIFIASPVVKAQEVMGVNVGGPFSTFDRLIKTKGFSLSYALKENIAGYSGIIGTYNVNLYVELTPISKQVFKASVFFDNHSKFSALSDQYFILQNALTNKYGTPHLVYDFFEDPYELGDGYEMLAVAGDKCHYFTNWVSEDPDVWNITIQITNLKSVKITYENLKAWKLYLQESDQLLQDGL